MELSSLTAEGSGEKNQTSRQIGAASRKVATMLLTRTVDDGRNLDALCDDLNGAPEYLKLPANDRGLARAIAATALRNRNQIDFVLSKVMDRKPPAKARLLLHTLHVAIAQILFMEVPDSAAVNLAVSAIGNDKRTSRFKSLANAVLRRTVREKDKFLKPDPQHQVFPTWLAQELRKDYGKENARKISQMVVLEPHLDITSPNEPEVWAQKLDGILLATGSIRLPSKTPVTSLPGYEDGQWWVQDAAAAIPARLLGDVAGKRVLDLCAAPGGKTAQLLAAGAKVTALDISETRLKRLAANLERLKFGAEIIAADILEWKPDELFDAVLLDAPCSSTGTVRRHPDVMWTKSKEDIDQLAQLQFLLLSKAREFVKPGGDLVFSNCSMLKQEGEDMLVRASAKISDIKLCKIEASEFPFLEGMINGQGALRTLPHHLPATPANLGGLDGFFACKFEKL